MRNFCKNFVFILGTISIMAGIFGLSYTYHIDHRTAESLSAYCRIDFQSSFTEDGKLEGAVLSIWDFRYDGARLLPKAVLYTDGDAWEMSAAVKQLSPKERDEAQDPDTSAINDEHPYQYENKLFVEMPRSSLPAIKKAETVRFRFYYDNGQTIDLPLNEPDLAYWKAQLIDQKN
jgi:hypothetical protein